MTHKKFLACWLIFTLHLALALPTAAAPLPESSARGKQYFDQGQFEAAYGEFLQAFLQEPGNPDLNFHLGRAAFETGRYEEAVMAYDRVLLAVPDAHPVKLELARAYLKMGTREVARQYFKEVLATNPPEQVWKIIGAFLASIEASEQKHFVNGTFTLGHAWSDNARLAPVSDRVSAGIFEFLLTGPSATPKRDQINSATLVLNHLYKNEDYPFMWKTTATSFNSLYQSQHDLDLNYLGLATGPVFQTANYIWDAQAVGSYIDVEHDRYQSSFGAASSLTAFFCKNFFSTLSVKAEEKNNYLDAGRDALNLLVTAGPVLVLDKNRLSLLLAKEHENADDAVNSYDRFAWKLRYDRSLPYECAFFAWFSRAKTDYDAPHPFFGVHRNDTVEEMSGGISRLLWQDLGKHRALVAQLGYTYTNSESNIDLYTYRKNVTEINLTVSF